MIAEHISLLLGLVPLIALAVLLLSGRYPAEELLTRPRRGQDGRRRAVRSTPLPRPAFTPPPSGGRLISFSRGGRAPPVPAP